MRKLKNYKPTRFMAEGSYYDKDAADHAVCFIEKFCCHTEYYPPWEPPVSRLRATW